VQKRFAVTLLFVALAACSPPKPAGPTPKPTPKPTPTLPPVTAGGIVQMGRTVITGTGSRITVSSWRIGANRSIGNGPGQRYETVVVTFCAGPQVEETAEDLNPSFALEMRNGNRIAPDSQSEPGEFRTKGAIHASKCVTGPIVYQVQGGERPKYVRFDSTKQTRWVVP
jgi:hypothetical protein